MVMCVKRLQNCGLSNTYLGDVPPLEGEEHHLFRAVPSLRVGCVCHLFRMGATLLIKQIDAVINCTPIRVKNKAKLTNFIKLIRIEGYSSEKGRIHREIRDF